MRRLALLVLLGAILMGCGDRQGSAVVPLRVGVFLVQDFLPYYVIQEQGFDRRHGLRFTEQSFLGGAAVMAAMAEGSLDMSPAVGTVPILSAAERGWIPEKMVAVAGNNVSDRNHPGIALFAANSISDWKDLRGKKIAVNAADSITAAAVKVRLRQEGVVNYSLVAIPFSNMGLALAGGNVSAAGMNEPYLTQSQLRGDGHLMAWVAGGPPFEEMQFTVILFSGPFHRGNPQAVKAYLRAHLAAVRWIDDHPREARLLLAKRLSLSRDVAERVSLLRWPRDARNSPELLEKMQRVLVSAELLRAPIPKQRLYDEALLEEVLKERQ